jgi:hypothetical protein
VVLNVLLPSIPKKRLDGTKSHNFSVNDDIAGTFTSSALPDALAISRGGAVRGTLVVMLRLAT